MNSPQKTPVQRIKRKYSLFRLIFLLPCLLAILFLVLDMPLLCWPLLAFSVILADVWLRFLQPRCTAEILRPLYADLDLAQYRANIAEMKWDTRSSVAAITQAMASGDHQQVLDIATDALFKETDRNVRLTFLTQLALSQFITGDIAALQLTLGAIDGLGAQARRTARKIEKIKTVTFFRHFVRGELALCEADCQQALAAEKLAFPHLIWEYLLAATYTQCHNKERAVSALNAILTREKNLPVFEEAARAQLLATNEGRGYEGLALRLSPAPCTAAFLSVSKATRSRRRRLTLSLILAIFCVTVSILLPIEEARSWDALSREVAANVERVLPGEQAVLLANFDVVAEDAVIDDICVLRCADGKLLIGSHFVYAGESTSHFAPYYKDVRHNTPLKHVANFDRSYTVTYCLYSDEDAIPADVHHTAELVLDGETLYFCVTAIEKQ